MHVRNFLTRKAVCRVPQIELKVDAYLALAKAAGHHTVHDQAVASGLNPTTIQRLIDKATRPGNRAIGALLWTYRVPFQALFEVRA